MTTSEMCRLAWSRGLRLQSYQPRADAPYWRAFAYSIDKDILTGAYQGVSRTSEYEACRDCLAKYGILVDGAVMPDTDVSAMIVGLKFAIEDNIHALNTL